MQQYCMYNVYANKSLTNMTILQFQKRRYGLKIEMSCFVQATD